MPLLVVLVSIVVDGGPPNWPTASPMVPLASVEAGMFTLAAGSEGRDGITGCRELAALLLLLLAAGPLVTGWEVEVDVAATVLTVITVCCCCCCRLAAGVPLV